MNKFFLRNTFFKSFFNWYQKTLRHPKHRWWLIAGTLLYILSPINLISDSIPILGWIDDGAILSLFVAEIAQLLLSRTQTNQQTVAQAASQTVYQTVSQTASQPFSQAFSDASTAVIDVKAVAVN
jgi:uncharacterized membrane protein YkvA (DUF1232 family)